MNSYMADFLRTASLIELEMLKDLHRGEHNSAIDRAIAGRRKAPVSDAWVEPDPRWMERHLRRDRERLAKRRRNEAAAASSQVNNRAVKAA